MKPALGSAERQQRQLARQIGPDPLADGAFDWPDLPAHKARADAVRAWRVWRVQPDGQLIAPFMSVLHNWTGWKEGENSSNRTACDLLGRQPHPTNDPGCTCGLRAVQSLTVAEAVMRQIWTTRYSRWCKSFTPCEFQSEIRLALGEVACYGNIAAASVEADDWPHTLRAEHMALTSDIEIA